MPFSIFRNRSLTGADVVGLLLGAVIFSVFFVLTLYVQQVLGWSALKTGITFLATAGTTVIWAGVSQALTTQVRAAAGHDGRPDGDLADGALGYTRLPVHGHYWPDLLPFYLLFALGMAFRFIPVSDRRVHRRPTATGGARVGAPEHEPADRRRDRRRGDRDDLHLAGEVALKSGHAATAFTSGYHWAFAALAIFAAAGAVAAFVLLRGVEGAGRTEAADAEVVHAAARAQRGSASARGAPTFVLLRARREARTGRRRGPRTSRKAP